MAIQEVSSSLSELDDEATVDLYDLLVAFLKINPSPTDDQVHALSLAVGETDSEAFEKKIFQLLTAIVNSIDEDDDNELGAEEDESALDRILSSPEDVDFEEDLLEEASEEPELNPVVENDPEKEALFFDGQPEVTVEPLKEALRNDGEAETEVVSPNEVPFAKDDGEIKP